MTLILVAIALAVVFANRKSKSLNLAAIAHGSPIPKEHHQTWALCSALLILGIWTYEIPVNIRDFLLGTPERTFATCIIVAFFLGLALRLGAEYMRAWAMRALFVSAVLMILIPFSDVCLGNGDTNSCPVKTLRHERQSRVYASVNQANGSVLSRTFPPPATPVRKIVPAVQRNISIRRAEKQRPRLDSTQRADSIAREDSAIKKFARDLDEKIQRAGEENRRMEQERMRHLAAMNAPPVYPTPHLSLSGHITLRSGRGCRNNSVDVSSDMPTWWLADNILVSISNQYGSSLVTLTPTDYLSGDVTVTAYSAQVIIGRTPAVLHITVDSTRCR